MDAVGSSSLETMSQLSLKKAVRSFTTLGGKDFVFICWVGQITHFMEVQSESQRLLSVSGAGHEGSSVDPELPSLSWHIFDYKVSVKIRV